MCRDSGTENGSIKLSLQCRCRGTKPFAHLVPGVSRFALDPRLKCSAASPHERPLRGFNVHYRGGGGGGGPMWRAALNASNFTR
jgi:hypothetical protein